MKGLVLLQAAVDAINANNLLNDVWHDDWMPITFLSLLISMFIVVIAYMISEFMRSPQLNAWAKNELYETLLSAFLVANLLVGLALMNTAIDSFVPGGFDPGTYPDDITPISKHIGFANEYFKLLVKAPAFEDTEAYFTDPIDEATQDAIKNALHDDSSAFFFGDVGNGYAVLMSTDLLLGAVVELYAMVNLPVMPGILGPAVGFMPLIGLLPILNALVMVTDFIAMIILSIIAQQAFLQFVDEQMFALFLPIGIVLRAFPLTRRLGSTIIAIAITCYIIYPLTLIMNLQIYGAMRPIDPKIAPSTTQLKTLDEPDAFNLAFPEEMQLTEDEFEKVFEIDDYEDPVQMNPDDIWLKPGGGCPTFSPLCHIAKLKSWIRDKIWPIVTFPVVLLKFILSAFFDTQYIFDLFIMFVSWAARSAVIVGTLFIIDIIVCITFFRSISTSIGGEAQIMGLAKVL